jgi:hypothetical protein
MGSTLKKACTLVHRTRFGFDEKWEVTVKKTDSFGPLLTFGVMHQKIPHNEATFERQSVAPSSHWSHRRERRSGPSQTGSD